MSGRQWPGAEFVTREMQDRFAALRETMTREERFTADHLYEQCMGRPGYEKKIVEAAHRIIKVAEMLKKAGVLPEWPT